jgi:hypothetical protein
LLGHVPARITDVGACQAEPEVRAETDVLELGIREFEDIPMVPYASPILMMPMIPALEKSQCFVS